MRDDDSFRLISPDTADRIVFWVCVVVAASFLFGCVEVASPSSLPQASTRPIPCQITIAQYAAGERWRPHPPQPACAGAAREVPSHILSMPVQEIDG